MTRSTALVAAGLIVGLSACKPNSSESSAPQQPLKQPKASKPAAEAADLLLKAAQALKQMKSEPELKDLLSRSKGLFIVPSYGHAAATIGVRGGEGVLVGHQNGTWSRPLFYDVGGVSLGAQLGAEGGTIAMLLMSAASLHPFETDNSFSLNAAAKLTFVDYSAVASRPLDRPEDVVFWSDTKGAFAGATLSVTNISFDDEASHAYYGRPVTSRDVLSGKVSGPKSELERGLSGV